MSNSAVEQSPKAQGNTKAFVVLVVLTLAFVGVVGGAFYGGTVVGKSQAEESAAADAPALPEGAAAAFAQFRQQAQSGQVDEAAAQQLRQQIRGQLGQGGGQTAAGAPPGGGQAGTGAAPAAAAGAGAGAAGGAGAGGAGFGGFAAAAGFGGGAFGTITSVEGSELKIETPAGVVTVKLTEETTLREISDVSVEDLATGIRLTIAGTRDDSGTIEARTITIVPEGVEFGVGQGFRPGQGIGGGQGFGGRQRGQGGGP